MIQNHLLNRVTPKGNIRNLCVYGKICFGLDLSR
jgi:hypothetical protein